jgi:hypothetical protein
MSIAAVITADIVNSTLLSVKEQRKLLLKIETILTSHKFEFYRGDSFQVIVKNPEQALTLALQVRMAARVIGARYDVRISIGIGSIQSRAKKISLSTGEAFTLSGRAFDSLSKSDSRLSIQLADDNPGLRVICYRSLLPSRPKYYLCF